MPSVTATPDWTNYLASGSYAGQNYSGVSVMNIGNVNVGMDDIISRGILQWSIPALLEMLPEGAVITGVHLSLTASGGAVMTGTKTFTAKRVTSNSVTSACTWNTTNGSGSWTTAGGDATSTHADSWSGTAAQDPQFDSLYQILSDAINTGQDELTLLVSGYETAGSSQFKTPYSLNAPDPDDAPLLTIDYVVASNNLTTEEAEALQEAWDEALETTLAGSTAEQVNTTHLSLPRLRLMDLLAACPTFRAIVGESTSTGAMQHIFSPHVNDTSDSATGRVVPSRPRAIINHHAFTRRRSGQQYGGSDGMLMMSLEVPPPPAAGGDSNLELSAADELFGRILDEMEERCGQTKVAGEGVMTDEDSTHLNHTVLDVAVGPSQNYREEESGEIFYGMVVLVSYV